MSANSSSTDGLLVYYCSNSKLKDSITTVVAVVKNTLIVPLCTFILYLGLQRWRQQTSSTSAGHSDLFTYHLAVMELSSVFGVVLFFTGRYLLRLLLIEAGICFTTITFYGEMFFQVLTCVEWYLAVVHPVTYLRLRNRSGIRIRNICIGCVWLLCFVLSLYGTVKLEHSVTALFCCIVASISVTSFCSFTALWVLIRPGPGAGGEDQSKRRAFYTITAISSVLWVWFIGLLVASALERLALIDEGVFCVAVATLSWFNLPTSLVLPLLFLHRAGRLACFYTRD